MADRPRLTIAAVFALHGAAIGTFATRIPSIQERLGLSAGQLGLALVMPAIGGALTMPLASRLMHRYGSRTTTRALMTFAGASLVLPAVAPGLVALCVALWVSGAAASMADVAMNAEGVEIETRLGRPIMSGLHGMWSVGGLLASGAGALAAHERVPPYVHLPVVAVVLVVLVQVICRRLPDVRPAVEDEPPPRFALPPADALLIGLVGFCAVFAEGAGTDWSGVFLRDVVSASPATAALGYGVFAGTMAGTRLLGDLVVGRIGAVGTVRVAGGVGFVGAVLIVSAVNAPMVIAGLALTGAGIAVVVPLAFGAAGKRGANPSRSIAGVATLTYASGLVAPAATGAIAQATSLRVAFGLVGALVLMLIPGAVALRPRAGQQV